MAEVKDLPSVEELYERFIPDFDNGLLYWKKVHRNKPQMKDRVAGGLNQLGYCKVSLDGKLRSVHRVLWKMYYKTEPPPVIDHINRVKNDNRISNLREADAFLNSYNSGLHKNNTSGIKGISRHIRSQRYVVTKMLNGKDNYIGSFKDFESAKDALADWCSKRGIKFAISPQGLIPEEWLLWPVSKTSR